MHPFAWHKLPKKLSFWCRMAVTKHFKLTAGLRGCSGEVGGCSGRVPSPGAVRCAVRVQGHLYPCRLCPDLGDRGGGGGVRTWDLQQTGLISCAGSCPGQGLGTSVLDHEQRPLQAEVVTIPCHFSYAAFLATRCWKGWTSSSFHFSVISTDFDAFVLNMRRTVSISWCGVCIKCITCSSEIADVLPF